MNISPSILEQTIKTFLNKWYWSNHNNIQEINTYYKFTHANPTVLGMWINTRIMKKIQQKTIFGHQLTKVNCIISNIKKK